MPFFQGVDHVPQIHDGFLKPEAIILKIDAAINVNPCLVTKINGIKMRGVCMTKMLWPQYNILGIE